jgi:hypothetical protein
MIHVDSRVRGLVRFKIREKCIHTHKGSQYFQEVDSCTTGNHGPKYVFREFREIHGPKYVFREVLVPGVGVVVLVRNQEEVRPYARYESP